MLVTADDKTCSFQGAEAPANHQPLSMVERSVGAYGGLARLPSHAAAADSLAQPAPNRSQMSSQRTLRSFLRSRSAAGSASPELRQLQALANSTWSPIDQKKLQSQRESSARLTQRHRNRHNASATAERPPVQRSVDGVGT